MRFKATVFCPILVLALWAQIAVAADNDPVTVAGILKSAKCPLTDAQATKLKEFKPGESGGMAGIRELYDMFTEQQMVALKAKLGVMPARNDRPERARSLFQVIVLEKEGVPLTEKQVASIKALSMDQGGFSAMSEIYTEEQRAAMQKYYGNRGGGGGGGQR